MRSPCFIDRDFNEPLPPQQLPIFETPCYSIENFYVSPAVFEEILINKFHFSRVISTENTDNPFHICLEIYKERQSEFHEAVLLFNAWCACLIDIKNSTNQTANASLNEKLPKSFVSFSLQEISSNYDLEQIKNTFLNAPIVEEAVLQTKIDEFRHCEQHQVFRGKYELQFLIVMLRLFLKDANTKGQRTILKEKIKFAFGDAGGLNQEQAIDIFNDCAETPPSLKRYLKQVTTE